MDVCVCTYMRVCVHYVPVQCRPCVNTGCFPPLYPSHVIETRSFSKMGTSCLIKLTDEWSSESFYFCLLTLGLQVQGCTPGSVLHFAWYNNLIMKKVQNSCSHSTANSGFSPGKKSPCWDRMTGGAVGHVDDEEQRYLR